MKSFRILAAVLAVAAASIVMIGATVALEVASDVAPAADATLVGCSNQWTYHTYTGLRTGAKSVCTQTYGAAAQQREKVLCLSDVGDYYYRYGNWVGVNGTSTATCSGGYDIAMTKLIEHRNI